MEEWKRILEFPDYSISNQGRVRNDVNRRMMAILVNQRGIAHVGMTKGRHQYKRSIARLVAEYFLPEHPNPNFDTPINLDGDRLNNEVENLAWRPKWFAMRYVRQFHKGIPEIIVPIKNMKTGEVFSDSRAASIHYGLLEKEILHGVLNHTYVWPTYIVFGFHRS